MPYLDVALRQALGLVISCPSQEDITAACAARGLQLHDGQLVKTGPADGSTFEGRTFAGVKATRAKRTAAVKALQEL